MNWIEEVKRPKALDSDRRGFRNEIVKGVEVKDFHAKKT